jgi:cellulose synthase/poly-beta-1,6-N-acetylglucosamine synthase-like glycosyltransferase
MKLISILFEKKYRQSEDYPPISVIIAAYNEEKVIKKTIENFFSLQYPEEKFEIVMGSDGSTDNTNEIIKDLRFHYPKFKAVIFPERRGKKAVINDLVKEATGEILIFSDSNTYYQKDSIYNLVKFYADERVGGVCGRLELLSSEIDFDRRNKEVLYWDYESWIKNSEGKLGVLIGANGGIYSIRKQLFVEMPSNVPVVDDLFISLKILEQRKDFIYAKDAIAREFIAPSLKLEYERKVRIVPRSFETIKQVKTLLFTRRFIVSYGLWSHKIIRWSSPIIFMIIFLSNILLLNYLSFYKVTFILQLLFLIFVFAGYVLSSYNVYIRSFQICFYFFIGNLALLKGIFNYLYKKHKPIWQPTPRK